MPRDIQQELSRLNQQVIQLNQRGQYEQAIAIAAMICDLIRQDLGENHVDFATSLNNLAELYQLMGNYAAAEPLYRQALEIERTTLGENHVDFATSLNNLAVL